jgi:hypothetical protein
MKKELTLEKIEAIVESMKKMIRLGIRWSSSKSDVINMMLQLLIIKALLTDSEYSDLNEYINNRLKEIEADEKIKKGN